MNILLFRIDDRLIHGQVVEGWARFLKVDRIIVCNDIVAEDKMQKTLMSMSCPPPLEVSVLTIEQTKQAIIENRWTKEKVLILFSNPKDVLTLINKGVTIKQVNVGGLHYCPGKVQVQRAVSLDEEDLRCFEQMHKLGIKIYCQVLPTEEKVDIN